jgi:DUF1365 family protein
MSWLTIIINTFSYRSTKIETSCESLNKVKRKLILISSRFEWWKSFFVESFRDFINNFNVFCLFSNYEIIINKWFCKNDQKLTDEIHKLMYCSARNLSEEEKLMLSLTISLFWIKVARERLWRSISLWYRKIITCKTINKEKISSIIYKYNRE